MGGYIKRDTAIRAVMAAKWVDGSDGAMAMEIVASPPAADVAPVVHGRWVDRIVDENEVIQPWMERYYCSECLEGGSQSWFKFCPNCGAKMDEEETT